MWEQQSSRRKTTIGEELWVLFTKKHYYPITVEVDNMYQGYWQTTVGVELKGKILGLIGLGKVGSQVAKIGKAFGMQVMAWSENLNLDKCKELDVLPSSKEDIIQNSDFISIHVQGGERYKDCFKLAEFDKMKKTAFLAYISNIGQF